jgi:hypothetical protein
MVLIPAAGGAGETVSASGAAEISGTESLEAEYIGDNGSANEGIYGDDGDLYKFRNILDVSAKAPGFESAVRLDAVLFQDPPYRVSRSEFIPGGSGYTTLNFDNDVRVERLYGAMRLGNLKITLGDFHVNFGRGMALSLIKVDDIGEDNALRGARVDFRLPRKLKAVLVGGVVNSLNVDPLTRQVLRDDPLDRILGARVEWELFDAFALGAHGVLMKPRFEAEDEISDDRLYVDRAPGVGAVIGGGSAEAHLEGFHVYLEGNYQQHDNFRAVGRDVKNEPGAAVFGEISYDLSPFSVKAEGIFYRRWLVEGPYRGSANHLALLNPISYNHMVTLEPAFVPIKSIGNVYGGRVTGDVYVDAADLQITMKSAFLHYLGGLLPRGEWDDHPETTVIHPILTARQRFDDTDINVTLEGGYRYETTNAPDIPGAGSGWLWHLKGDVTVPIRGPHSVEAAAEVRRHALGVTEGIDYWVSSEMLSYHWSGLFGVTLAHEFSDEVGTDEAAIWGARWPLPPHHYAWVRAGLEVPKPLDDLDLGLFFGSQRGGIKCAGGVCRRYPDSIGAKLEAVYRF